MQRGLVALVSSVKRKGRWHWVAGLNVERKENGKVAIKTFLIILVILVSVDADGKM